MPPTSYIKKVIVDSRSFVIFLICYGILEACEVSKNLPGALGSVFPKYVPILRHGEPIHPILGDSILAHLNILDSPHREFLYGPRTCDGRTS